MALHESGQLNSALLAYQKVLARQPCDPETLHLVGVLHGQLGEHDRGIAYLRQAIALKHDAACFHSNLGLTLHLSGRHREAEAAYREALTLDPDYVDALFNLGNTLHSMTRPAEAEAAYRHVILRNPNHAPAHNNLGNVLREAGRLHQAEKCYEAAIAASNSYADAWTNLGLARAENGQTDAAIECYRAALAINPRSAETLCNLASALLDANEYTDEAVEAARIACEVQPKSLSTWLVLGSALQRRREWDLAADCYRCALEIKPGDVQALNGLGAALQQSGNIEGALHCFQDALTRDAEFALTHFHLGTLFKDRREYKHAEQHYRHGLALDPDSAAGCNNLGNVLEEQQRLEEALEWYERALRLNPKSAETHSNVGNILRHLGRTIEAEVHSRRAVDLNPNLWAACNNLGAILDEQGRSSEALPHYRQALSVQPENATLWHNFGNALADAKQLGAALLAYDKAIELAPDDPAIIVALGIRRQQACDWRDYGALRRRSIDAQTIGAADPSPFSLLSIDSTPEEQLAAARLWSAKHQRGISALPSRTGSRRRDRLKIGYLSADLRKHAVAYLAAELFELHDRRRFEIIGYSYGPDDQSSMRARLAKSFDRFVNIRSESHDDTAERIRSDDVDILVDLTGITQFCRPRILAHRAAPIQVNYLGYPGTTGADYIDYILVDAFVVPPRESANFSEKLVWLPHSYQVNDRRREVSPSTPSRAECGLPEVGFVFSCFNNTFKINPATFDSWMRILARVPDSVLWLLGDNEIAIENLRREAEARNIDATRLVFAPRCEMPAHLTRQKLADLVLDTLPYNAHTTTSDALWVGVPVLTLPGRTFASRVAGSLLQAVGLPELIATTRAEYESLAVRLAADTREIGALRAKLEGVRQSAPLFDTPRMVKDIEMAYERMWERYERGEAPDHIAVGP